MSRSVIRLPTPPIDDHYRLHDVFHLAHAAVLDRSPVIRSLMKLKRRSRPDIDLAEDGGRAIAIEEAMSALVFAYASEHNYLEGKAHVDNALLETIRSITAQLRGFHSPRRRLGEGHPHRLPRLAAPPRNRRRLPGLRHDRPDPRGVGVRRGWRRRGR